MPIATLCLPRRPTPRLRRIDEQGCPASFANLGAERVHVPALEAPARVDRRRGLPTAAPAIKAIVTISHEPTSPLTFNSDRSPARCSEGFQSRVGAAGSGRGQNDGPPRAGGRRQRYAFLEDWTATRPRPYWRRPYRRRSSQPRLNEHSGRGKATRPRRGRGWRCPRKPLGNTRCRQPRPSPRWRAGR